MILLQKSKKTYPTNYTQAVISQYTISVPCNNGWSFYNTHSGAVVWNEKPLLNLNSSVARQNGLVVSQEFDEASMVREEYTFSVSHSDTLDLTIQTTMDCLCRCVYCYQGIDKEKNCTLGEKEIVFLNQWITPKLRNYKRLFINWFGGEPLLNVSAILKLSSYLIRACSRNNCDYNSCIVTNGILLNNEIIRQLLSDAWVRSFSLTIDGPRKIHDQRRIRKNGEGTFDDICRALDTLLQFSDAHITLRLQVDKENLEYMPELFAFLQYKKWFSSPNIKLVFVRTKDRTQKCSFQKSLVIEQSMWGMVEKRLYALCSEFQIPYTIKLAPYPAGGCQNKHFHVFNPTGSFFPCHALASEVPMTEELKKQWETWLPWKAFPECGTCVLFPICQGGCPFNTLHALESPIPELPCPDWRFSIENRLIEWTKIKFKENGCHL